MSNVRSEQPPTRFPAMGSYGGTETMQRWATSNRENPKTRARRARSEQGTSIRKYRDTYSSEDKPKRLDHPKKWNRKHATEQRRTTGQTDPGTYTPSATTDVQALAARLGVEL